METYQILKGDAADKLDDFTKVAMQGLCAVAFTEGVKHKQYNESIAQWVAKKSVEIAKATILELEKNKA